jgi:hypothetical protein
LNRRGFLIALGLAVACGGGGPAAGADVQRPQDAGERQAIQEANALLQEEIKLAARPQTYVLVDVHHGVVLVKARSLELHRLPLLDWRPRGTRPPAGLFTLTVRPPVDRPRTMPGEDATEHPIELSDMPAEYTLVLEPSLVVLVGPPLQDHPWLWIRGLLREGWTRIASVGAGPWLRITLSSENARSLAWLLTDGMPVLIGRSTLP